MTTPTAPKATTPPFTGFSRDAVEFLAALSQNNERPWFNARKVEYERLLKEPLAALCAALAERFSTRELPLTADPAKSPFRIYRDVRFSPDKSPYKTHLGASFPWTGEGSGSGGYFHFAPGEIFVGGGMWHPDRTRLAGWRALILEDPERVHRAVDDPAFVRTFGGLDGDKLKRAPAGVDPDHPDIELLKLKDVTFGRRMSDDEAFSPALPEIVADALADAVPVMRLLATLPLEAPAGEPGWLRGHGR